MRSSRGVRKRSELIQTISDANEVALEALNPQYHGTPLHLAAFEGALEELMLYGYDMEKEEESEG